MYQRNIIVAFALACGAFLQPSIARAQAQPAAHAHATSSTAAAHDGLAQVLTRAVQRGDAPGLVGLVVDRNGVLFEGAAGKLSPSRPDAMPVNAIFNIASMTKPVTSVAIMMLLEHGSLRSRPVSKYLPGFDNLRVITKFNKQDGTYETRPAKRPITLRHLLTHTSGIGYGFSNPIVARLQQGNNKMEWEFPLLNDPGDKWNYSASTRVLGLVVEKITARHSKTLPEKHLPAARDGGHVVRRCEGQAGARRDAPQSRRRKVRGAPRATRSVDSDSSVSRRWRPVLHGARVRALHADAAERRHLGPARILTARSVRLMGLNQIGKVFVTEQPAAIPALTKPFPLGAGRDKFGLGFQISERAPTARPIDDPGA